MKIVFRVDSSVIIGTGHVMRCLTLADEFQAKGNDCHFICREHSGNLIKQIILRGFTVSCLPTSDNEKALKDLNNSEVQIYENWLGETWLNDVSQTIQFFDNSIVDLLIIDHYGIDEKWEKEVRPLCRKIMVIDDLANRIHDCDILLDQNIGRDINNYHKLVQKGCTVLTGPKYALLRPEFLSFREKSLQRRITPKFKQLLISMGGVDISNVTVKILEALQAKRLPADIQITIVLGLNSPWIKQVKAFASQMMQPTTVKVNVSNMAEIMSESDFAIGAAGSTTWEFFCLGLPSILLVLAPNQLPIAEFVSKIGAALIIKTDEIFTKLPDILLDFASIGQSLQEMSKVCSAITDGNGTSYVVRKALN